MAQLRVYARGVEQLWYEQYGENSRIVPGPGKKRTLQPWGAGVFEIA